MVLKGEWERIGMEGCKEITRATKVTHYRTRKFLKIVPSLEAQGRKVGWSV